MIGDATNLPTLKASASFAGMAVIDADPYNTDGSNWFTNQNNFFRQIKNFNIDLTAMPPTAGAGIHWQVAQATSLQNIVFNMVKGGAGNAQQGIFMDNGSGGFMTDLVFNGGNYGAFFGNQQFTTRNLTFNDCNTAVFMNWNWVWNLKGITVNNCQVGVNMSSTTNVGSAIIQDGVFTNTPTGIVVNYQKGSTFSNGTLVVDNCDFSGSQNAIVDVSGTVLQAGGSKLALWAQGHGYGSATASTAGTNSTKTVKRADQVPLQGALTAPAKPSGLLDASGKVFEKSKPSYADVPASSFVSVKSGGAKGDGTTDDTAAIQKVLDGATADQVVYFDHGAYLIKDTVNVPKNIRITGELWPLIMADGASFNDESNPKPVFQIGAAGDTGAVEISDMMFETLGPAPGAILIEWNVAATSQGATGMWDVHGRVGGSAGTKLQSDTCSKNPNVTADANPDCVGAFMQLHVTSSGSVYLENTWMWTADHELDLADHNQINIYTGRGILIESTQPTWLYGTASEHNQLFNYQLNNAQNVYMCLIQTETPYMQSNPDATQPFKANTKYNDPTYDCTEQGCKKTWGLRSVGSSDVLVYGGGLYSFFENYDQDCLLTRNCQANMISIEKSTVEMFGITTIASTNMITVDGTAAVQQADNIDVYGSSIAQFSS